MKSSNEGYKFIKFKKIQCQEKTEIKEGMSSDDFAYTSQSTKFAKNQTESNVLIHININLDRKDSITEINAEET